MKTFKYIVLGLVVILVAIQFIARPEKIEEPVTNDDIIVALAVNVDMSKFLKGSCYDCHSNQPSYPWYFDYAPMNWKIAEHIEDGRKHLNFSEWQSYTAKKQDHKLEEMIEEVESMEMPLAAYRTFHPEANVSQEELDMLRLWILNERQKLSGSIENE